MHTMQCWADLTVQTTGEEAGDDMGASYNQSSSFALIVVLFILLIIVGTAFVY
jgi:conserved hypothetical tiny transmembrane protein